MQTLTLWVGEFNGLVRDVGRNVIERAQSYYDALGIWQQVVQEYARQQEEVDLISGEFDRAVRNLSRAEAAFVAFAEGDLGGDLPEEEWLRLVPHEGLDPLVADDPKLARTYRVSVLADCVARLQWQRDSASAELGNKDRELVEARRRFEAEELKHRGCTWNCSVKRAAPFYEKRRMHEYAVDAQLSTLHAAEQRLQGARRRVVAAQREADATRSPSLRSAVSSRSLARFDIARFRSLDEMSQQSFEIAGGEPGEDDFLSCGSAHGSDAEDAAWSPRYRSGSSRSRSP